MKKTAIYPGTFDPITLGHVDMIKRASKLFDQVIVGIAVTKRKSTLFTIEQRLEMCQKIFASVDNVETKIFDNRIVDFAEKHHAQYLIKGLRNVTDFDYEMQMATMNQAMNSHVETLFLPASPQYSYISATMVREIISLKGDVSPFVDPIVLSIIKDYQS